MVKKKFSQVLTEYCLAISILLVIGHLVKLLCRLLGPMQLFLSNLSESYFE